MRPFTLARAAMALPTSLAVLSACGGGQTRPNLFSTDWEDDRGVSIGRVWQRVANAPVAPSTGVVVGVAEEGDAIVGLALPLGSGANHWTYAHSLDARPVAAGSVVMGSGGGEVFALEAATGRLLWKRPTGGLALIGAGDDGTVTVATFQRSGKTGSVLLAVTRDGQMVRQIETDKPLGTPAVVGRMAFVPWAGQYVSVIDLENGDEAARVTLREETSRAWTEGGSLWFGEVGFIRFDERIRNASKGKASAVTLPGRDLPGVPKLMPPGVVPLPAVANAEDKVRLYARPVATESGAAISGGRWYATYFRVAMGFDANAAKLTWAHLHPVDFLGGAASSGGVVLCDGRGKVSALDAQTGAVLGEGDLGRPVRLCIVNADTATLHGPATDAAPAKPLVEQLEEVVRADDPQLASAQKVLLRELSVVSDESATKTLVDLASDPRTGPDLLIDARAALARRRNGARFMTAALERHYDYLKDVLRAPPVGPLAEALGAMKTKTAAPLLAAHLLDPTDTDDDVRQAAAALATLAEPAELPALRQFFGMYRGSADNDDIGAAVVSVASGLISLREPADRAAVEAAVHDPMTTAYARDRLGEVVASVAAPGARPKKP